ncbi:MAG: hypothetical protein QF807_03935 [Candidatus Thalassarchaeaceae archaeon]|nr:hypothetical protein [Candidatus Thalassarchaeaceae archaeon]MDP7043147.1 hypothetical protein [Candidatus Thalassarchaeaceae archaeon]
MADSLTLGIDVGTSATKVLLLRSDGQWDMASWPSSEGVWDNLRAWLGSNAEMVDRVGITGHGPSAIVIRDGAVCGRVIPWHESLPEGCERRVENDHILPPTRAWVPSRIAQWEQENGPIGDGVAVQLKDKLNWELTGVIARDSRSMRGYSGVDYFHLPGEVIGQVSEAGSILSGISVGAEVICGCDDLSAGVLGLSAVNGDIFNLANTSEHVGLVGGEPQEMMSWLPALGRLPSLCYNATSTGGGTLSEYISGSKLSEDAWGAIQELNIPIEDIRGRFPPRDMLIGGGLAMIPQLVESRGATLRAGQEVSALGVAKLAQRPSAVIFGAGKVGRGFLAHLLFKAGWQVSFVDVSEEVVGLLDGSSYTVANLGTGAVESIGPVSALSAADSEAVAEAVKSADLLMTSIGGDNLATWAESINEAVAERLMRGPIDIILCENHPRPAALVSEIFDLDGLGVAQAQVLRSCIEPTDEQIATLGPLVVQVQDHWILPLDGDVLMNPELLGQVTGFEARPNFSVELTRKLYTYNAINAAVCFPGAERGYVWLADAANDSEIAELAKRVGEESSAALIAEYGFDANEQRGWCERALAKYQDATIRDPIERNARDPIRKLGLHDRILGPLHLCISHGLPHTALVETMKSALAYREPSDDSAVKLSKLVDNLGYFGTIQIVAEGTHDSVEELIGS